MNGTTTNAVIAESLQGLILTSRLPGASISSLSSLRHGKPLISIVYKQASALFLTRQLVDALSTIEPIITLPDDSEGGECSTIAPIASASRNTRIKVWNLYLALLNAIIELSPEEGKSSFGIKRWRSLVAKARDGTVWQDVLEIGYGGIEGKVDAEIVTSLATLLLAHSPSQINNQQRLETYLLSSNQPDLDVSRHVESSRDSYTYQIITESHNNGTGTLHELNSRTKVLELYALHVLPRNKEWQYAREFISISEVLDEGRREFFLSTLQILESETIQDYRKEAEIVEEGEGHDRKGQKQAGKLSTEITKSKQALTSKDQTPINHKRTDNEKDYGIEASRPEKASKPQLSEGNGKAASGPPKYHIQLSPNSHTHSVSDVRGRTSVYKKCLTIMYALQHLISSIAHSLSKDRMILLKTILFLTGLILAVSRRDSKERARGITRVGWDKIKGTVGMGVKVSYI